MSSLRWTEKEVVALLRAVEHLPISELSVECAEFRVILRSRASNTMASGEEARASASRSATLADGSPPSPQAVATGCATVAGAGVVVRAPRLGTFRRSVSPGAPPFVDVDREVSPEDTVGLLDVLGATYPVHAGVKGRVTRVLIEDGALVEYRQPLLVVEPT